MTDPRPVFAAVAALRPGIWNMPGAVTEMDALLGRWDATHGRCTINAAGLRIVKESEGCKLTAYRCPAGVLTIGYGSTGPHVLAGMTITQEAAEALLRGDLQRFEYGVAEMCPVATGNQFSAMVSLSYNIGLGAFRDSTLRRKHVAEDYAGAQAQFGKWVKAGGRTLPGLVKRRAREAELYGAPA